MKRTIKTQFGEFKCEFVGYRGTTLRHYWIYSNKADSKKLRVFRFSAEQENRQ